MSQEELLLKQQVTQLLNDKRTSELTALVVDLAGANDEKFIEKWLKKDVDPKVLREFYMDIMNVVAERRKKASLSVLSE